jgi:DNA polymerase III sliding clamp (beta) subunit (PCNA family)/GNAT superfamily N-acetyltransferase
MDAKELKEKIDSVVVKYNEKPKDGEYGVISLMNEINDLIEENGAFHTLKGAENPLIYEMFYLNSILKWNKTYKHKVSLLESYFNEQIYKVSMNQNIFNFLPKSKRENVNKLTLNSYEPTDKSMKDLVSVFCSTDDLRPALMGANYNELGVVSTDAYKMLFLNKKDNKYKKDVTKCITDYCVKSHKKLGVTESQFPNWKLITPTKDNVNFDFVFDVDALFSYLTICLNFGLFYKGGVGERDAVVTFNFLENNNSDDSVFSFNVEYFLDCLKSLIKLGISEARINYSSPSKAIVFTDAKIVEKDFLNQNFILLMPVITGNMYKNYYFDFKTNSVVYGEKKYEFPIGIEDKVKKEINTFEYKDVKINITLDELSNYPKIKDKLSKLSDSKLKKSISGGCSTNYNIGSNTYSCKYNIIEVENETNVEKKESISTIYNIEILNGTFGNQDVSHDVERKVLEYFGRIKKIEEVKSENKKETPAESKSDLDLKEKPYQVYSPITQNVEGYFENKKEAEQFAKKFEYSIVYDIREEEKVGKEFWYEYHCFESSQSCDAEIWYRSHQKVKVLDVSQWSLNDKELRQENGQPRLYLVEWEDGFKYEVFEDELMESKDEFYRPAPPKKPILNKKEETPTESKSDLEFLNEMLKTSKNLLDLISDTGNKEDIDYLKKKIETTKNLISLLSIDEKKKFENGGLIAPNGKPSKLTPEQYKLVRTPAFKEWFGDWENDPANASKVVDKQTKEPLVVYHGSRSTVDFAFSEFKIPQEGVFFSSDYTTASWFSSGASPKLFFGKIEIPKHLSENSDIKDLEKYYKENLDPTAFVEINEIKDLKNGKIVKTGDINYRINTDYETGSSPLGGSKDLAQKKLYKKILNDIGYENEKEKRPFYHTFLNIRKPFVIDGKGQTFDKTPFEGEEYSAVSVSAEIKERGKNDGVIIRNTIETTEYDFTKKSDTFIVFQSNQIKLADGTNTTFDGNNPDIRFDYGGMPYIPTSSKVSSSRIRIPNVRGGWTKEKIIKYFKERSSDKISTYRLTKYISEFDNWQQFKDHIYYHGTQNFIGEGLKPSITMSERDAERNGGGGYGERYFGISLTKNKKTAETFSGMSRSVTIYPVILKRDAKVIERTDLQDASEIEDIIVDLYEKGIDAVWIGGGEEELVVINPYSVLLYDKGSETHQVYGGFKSVPLTDDKIKEIYDNSLLLWNEYSEELKTKLNKDEKNDFFYSLPKIQFEDGGEIKQLESENGGKLSYILNGKEVGYLDYIYDLSSYISDDLSDYNNELYIDGVNVEEEFRNKGIAKKLINKIIEFSKRLGVEVVSLRRDSGLGCNYGDDYDQYLKKIYESIGFIEINEDCGMMYNNKFEDGGQARPFTDDGNKYVVFNEFRNYNPYKIAVNDVNNADYITLWKTDMNTGKDEKVGALKLNETSDGFLSVSEIGIDAGSKGLGLGLEMYKVALKYSSDKIKGIKSYLPNRTNKKQIPKIYKKLNSVEDGDYEFIYKEHNPNIKFNDGGNVLLAPNGKPSKLTPEQYKIVRTKEFKEWFGDWENDPANASKVIDKETKEPLLVYHGTNNDFTIFNKSKLGSKNFFAESSYLGFFFASNIKTSEAYIGMNTMDMAGVSFGAYDDVLDEYKPTMDNIEKDIKKVYEEISEKYKKEELDKANQKLPFSEKLRDAGFTEEEWFKYLKEYAERKVDWDKISELSKEENDSNGNNQKYNELKDLMYNKIEEKWKVKTNSNPRIIKLFLNIREPHIVDYRDNDKTELSFDIKNAIEYKKDGVIFNNLRDGADVDDIFVAFEPNQIKLADGTNTTFDGNNPDIRFDDGGEATNYTEFFDRLKIEDGTKYIGRKFGDVFPFLKGSFSTPFKYKLRVKQYNDYLKRLSEDNYTTKAMKQRDLNKIENNKGRINKVKYLSEFVCDSTGTIIDFKHNPDVFFADGGSVSTSRFYATKEVSNWNDIPSTWKNINKVNKVNLKLDPNDDKFNSVFKKFLSTDELRPVMMGYNIDENGITCTNATILAVIPTKENLQKGIFLNGKEIDGKYPNYNAVIPKDNFKSISRVDSYKLLQYCNVALNYSDKSYFGCNFNTENGVITFNLKLLITILEASLKLGYEELYFKFKESNSGVVISNVEEPILGKDIIFLLFPMSNRGSEFKGTQNLDYDLELSCYFDFAKNEIINKDNSIVDFEMNYGENPIFTKEIISLLKLNFDTKSHLPILDNFLVEDKKIRLVNLDNNTTLLIKDVDAPTGLYYIQNNVAVYSDISIDDYPKKSPFFNDKPKAINKVNISSEYFKWILDVLNSSKGDDDLRPVMTGLNISYDGSELLFASTNGHSLGVIKANENVSFENKNNFNETINFGKISDLINLKKDSNVIIEFYQEGNFKIVTDGFDIVSKVIDGRYPNYSAVIPKNSSNKLTINNKKLIDALSSKEAQSFIKKVPSSKNATYSSLNILGEEKDGQLIISLVQTELNYRSDKEEKILDSKVIYTDDLIFDNDANIGTTDSCILLMPMQTKEPHLFYFNFSLFNKFIKPVNTQSFDLLFNNGAGKPYVVNYNNFNYIQKASKKEVSKPKEVKAVSLKPKKQIPAESNSDLEYLKGLLSTSKDLLDLISITGNKEDIDYLKEKIKVTKTLISLIE